MEERLKKAQFYKGEGTIKSPFIPLDEKVAVSISSFSEELAKDKAYTLKEGNKLYLRYSNFDFCVFKNRAFNTIPRDLEVYLVGPSDDDYNLPRMRAAVQYSQIIYSRFLLELLKEQFE